MTNLENILSEYKPAFLECRREALTTKTHKTFSQYIGHVFGGKATLIVTYDDEVRLTYERWLKLENLVPTEHKTKEYRDAKQPNCS